MEYSDKMIRRVPRLADPPPRDLVKHTVRVRNDRMSTTHQTNTSDHGKGAGTRLRPNGRSYFTASNAGRWETCIGTPESPAVCFP